MKNWKDYEPRWKPMTVKMKNKMGPMAQLFVVQWLEERSTWCKKCREMIKDTNAASADEQSKFFNWTVKQVGLDWLVADIKDCQEKAKYFAKLNKMSTEEILENF